MQRQRKEIVIGALFFALLSLGVLYVFAQSAPEENVASVILVIPQALTDRLPNCVARDDAGACTSKLLQGWEVQWHRGSTVVGDIYRKVGGDVYHARVVRVAVGSNWVWHVEGPAIWAKGLQLAKAAMPDSTGVEGPHAFGWLGTLGQAQCEALANALLVNRTTDGGELQPIPDLVRRVCNPDVQPNDAGIDACGLVVTQRSYPDGSTSRCGSGNWYLLQSRYGFGPVRMGIPQADGGYGHPLRRTPRLKEIESAWDPPATPTNVVCVQPADAGCP